MSSDFDLEQRTKKNVGERANRIKMEWDTPAFDGKMLLLVENMNDKRCYFKLFNSAYVEIQTTEGCNNMRRLFEAIQQTSVPNFAIQDSDFARVSGCKPPDSNYFITDFHDHEMMCLNNDEVMMAVFSNNALAYDQTLVDEVFDDLKMLSCFKWYNYYHHTNVNFKGYKVRGKVKRDLCSFDAINLEVMSQSPACHSTITKAEIDSFVAEQPHINRFELTNGHDFLDLLAQRVGERIQERNLRVEDLRNIIYASFIPALFKRTNLYNAISFWANDRASDLLSA